MGCEWYRPFDRLRQSRCDEERPALVVSTLQDDLVEPRLLAAYGGSPAPRRARHPLLTEGGLVDPTGTFHTFAVVPFVFLVDTARLQGRPVPRTWGDLLHPSWHDEIVFGGWRPRNQGPYLEYNSFLLLSLWAEFGASGLAAFSANVRGLVHNIQTARTMGTGDDTVGSIAILPWLHAELSPRRPRVRVIWPEDGALAMPIVYMLKASRADRVAPLVEYLTGGDLARAWGRSCYPSAFAEWPAGARLKWHGWSYVFERNLSKENHRAAALFFSRRKDAGELRRCA
jgi:ABC-type Fe3+ transport system substrate-binding protein